MDFPLPVGPDDREDGAGRNVQGNILEHGLVGRGVSVRFRPVGVAAHGWIGESQIPEFDFAADFAADCRGLLESLIFGSESRM